MVIDCPEGVSATFKYALPSQAGMAKKKGEKTEPKVSAREKADEELSKLPMPKAPGLPELPQEAQEKLKKLKAQLEKFKSEALKKFDQYIIGITLLPPPKPREGEKINKDLISVMMLIDDTDSTKMSKYELRTKLQDIMDKIAKEIDPNLVPEVIILSELWQNCYDAKYDLLQLIAMGAPVYDKGMLAAIKIAEVHKSMVLKKFEKYIVSYVLAGSLTQGRATPTSDIDVWVVIDDTDVKKMTRVELKDKLRAIIIGMGIEAGDLTGIKNKINIQVYILTDFWENLKEANPIIFTLLRDGVPFYDRGIFMPWKQLLKMGKIKPSAEAIDLFMSSGDSMIKRVSYTLKTLGMEDTYYAILTPSQAALMMYGISPPAPKETAELMREIFVKKLKLLEDKYVDILEANINLRKDLEHGTKKELSGKEIDKLVEDADKFLKRIKTLFTQIEKMKEEEDMVKLYDSVATMIRDVLKVEGVAGKVDDLELVAVFENELISKGLVPAKYLRTLNELVKAKKDYEEKKLSKHEVEAIRKEANILIRFLIEYVQRKRGRDLDRAKVRVKYGDAYGEVLYLDKQAFIIQNVEKEEKEVSKAKLIDGRLGPLEKSTLEEMEQAIAKVENPPRIMLKEHHFDDLKKVFGKEIEVLLG